MAFSSLNKYNHEDWKPQLTTAWLFPLKTREVTDYFLGIFMKPCFSNAVHVLSRYFTLLQNTLVKWTSLSFPSQSSADAKPKLQHTGSQAGQSAVCCREEWWYNLPANAAQEKRNGIICDARDRNNQTDHIALVLHTATLQYWGQGGMYELSAKYVEEVLVSLFP